MKKTPGRLVTIGILAALGMAGGAWFLRFSAATPEESPLPGAASNRAVAGALAESLQTDDRSEAEIAQLHSDPRVVQHLQRQRDRARLNRYFSREGAAGSREDAAIWQLIESIENASGMLAAEALALKLAWLERNASDSQAFAQAAEALIASYRQKASASYRAYDPYKDTPGFAEYKAEEAGIIAEVQRMTSFPQGKTRQQYLRQRLQAAREKAYGS